MRPIAVLGESICACGAVCIATPNINVFAMQLPVVVTGAATSHGGFIMVVPINVYANMLPVARIGDITPYCPTTPPHFCQPIVTGIPTVCVI